MCMSVVETINTTVTDEERLAYKVVVDNSEKSPASYLTPWRRTNLMPQAWNHDPKAGFVHREILGMLGNTVTYPLGYHCFTTKEAAETAVADSKFRCLYKAEKENIKVIPVIVRRIVAEGKQAWYNEELPVIVAEEIFPMPELKEAMVETPETEAVCA